MRSISEDVAFEASTFCSSFTLSIIDTIHIHLYYQLQFLRCTHMRCSNKLHTYHCVLLFHNDRYNYNFYIYSLFIVTPIVSPFTHFIFLDYSAMTAITIIIATPMTNFLWSVQRCLAWFIIFSIVVSSYLISPQFSPDS